MKVKSKGRQSHTTRQTQNTLSCVYIWYRQPASPDCVYVCKRERNREQERKRYTTNVYVDLHTAGLHVCVCLYISYNGNDNRRKNETTTRNEPVKHTATAATAPRMERTAALEQGKTHTRRYILKMKKNSSSSSSNNEVGWNVCVSTERIEQTQT